MITKSMTWVMLLFLACCPLLTAEDEKTDKEEQKSWVDKIDFSGEIRLRFEGLMNFDGSYPVDTSFARTLSRTRFKVEANVSEKLKAVIQFQDSRTWGQEAHTLADSKNVDLHQVYFQYSNIGDSPFSLKLGRQELVYGDERLIGAVGWSNVGRSFDAVKLIYSKDELQVDGFVATTNETGGNDRDASFGGVYASYRKTPVGNIEAYFLRKSDGRSIFFGELPGVSPDTLTINTMGFRLAGKLDGPPLSYQAEAAFQTGDYGPDEHEAFAAHARLVYDTGFGSDLRLLAEYNFASGDDDRTDGKHGTFDNLFPTNHNKYGYMDFIGWKNIEDVRIGISLSPLKGHLLQADYHLFNVATNHDNVYTAGGGVLLRIPAGVDEDEIGQEIDITWKFSPVEGLGVFAGYSHFKAGSLFDVALPETAFRDDADFLYLQTTVTF